MSRLAVLCRPVWGERRGPRRSVAASRSGAWRKQAGVTLLELIVVLAVSCLIAVWASQRWMASLDDAQVRATGLWLTQLQQGLARMLVEDFDTLSSDNRHAGLSYADPWSPTVDELRSAGHLPSGFPAQGPHGVTARIDIWRTGCPGPRCRLDGLVWLPTPWRQAGTDQPDWMRIGLLRLAGEGRVGAVYASQPTQIRSAHFNLPNPPSPELATLPTGSVASWAGMDASEQVYVRLHDRRDPDLQGRLTVAGNTSVGGTLQIGAAATAGQGCAPAGLLAHDGAGRLLNCVAGIWREPGQDGGHFGGAFYQPEDRPCSYEPGARESNPLTGRCRCPPGFIDMPLGRGFGVGHVCVR